MIFYFFLQTIELSIKFDLLSCITGKSLSEALIFVSTNPQYDDRLFIELQVQYMKIPSSNLGRTCCVRKLFLTFITIFVYNMFSPCSAKRRASDKDLPVAILIPSGILVGKTACFPLYLYTLILVWLWNFKDGGS
jgi:hypothetical protein